MKKYIFLGLVIISILSSFVFASDNAPPPIPTEYWGQAIIDGVDATSGTPITSIYGDTTVAADGYYDIMLTGGDHELTNLSDSDCSLATAAGRACIPCSTNPIDEDYCIEGPQEGDLVVLNFDGNPVNVVWGNDAVAEENVLASMSLYSGWNMISLPSEKEDTSIQSYMDKLSGRKIAYYWDPVENGWDMYDSDAPPIIWDLLTLEPKKGYWLKVDSEQDLAFIGKKVADTTIDLKVGWNMVGFMLYNDIIENAMASLTGRRIAYYWDSIENGWDMYDSDAPPIIWDLLEINAGRGYWLKVDSDQTWEGT